MSKRNEHFRTIYNKLNNAVKQTLIKARKEKWNTFLSTLRPEIENLWKISKTILKKSTTIPLLQINGVYYYSDSGKANGIVDHFENAHKQNTELGPISFTQKIRTQTETYLDPNSIIPENVEIATPEELRRIIKSLKNKKSPRLDCISSRLLKILPQKAMILLTRIVNSTMLFGYFPTAWKVSKTIAIKKSNKPLDMPSVTDLLVY